MKTLEDNNNKNYTYTIESYAILINVDKSILRLNDLTTKNGYEILFIDIEQLEKKFMNLFSTERNNLNETYEEPNFKGSNNFLKILINNDLGSSIFFNKGLYLIKSIKNADVSVINNTINPTNTIPALNKLKQFTEDLIQQLKLFKNGDICDTIYFQISANERSVNTKLNVNNKSNRLLFTFIENETNEFMAFYKSNLKINNLTEVALKKFNLSYEISDQNTRFITLMTGLECLFNQDRT